jgi:pyruvate dehydrogenase E2 component (dihydrolipoamide acetyltransferase)
MLKSNVGGRWAESLSTWRKISLATWSRPDNAQIYGTLDVDAERLVEFLAERSRASGIKCTMTHAATRALAMALARYPDANVLVRGRRIWQRDSVDIFVLVSMPKGEGPKGADLSGSLIVGADRKRVEDIARELAEKAQAVRTDKDPELAKTRGLLKALPVEALAAAMKVLGVLQYDLNLDLPGLAKDSFGGATITSVGMLGVKQAFTPLTTFTRCAMLILVGKIEDEAVVRDGKVVARPMCTVTGTFDHRVFDGILAGRISEYFRSVLEEPERLDGEP